MRLHNKSEEAESKNDADTKIRQRRRRWNQYYNRTLVLIKGLIQDGINARKTCVHERRKRKWIHLHSY